MKLFLVGIFSRELIIVCTPPPPFLQGRGLNLLPNFQKGWRLDRTSTLRGGLLEKRGVTLRGGGGGVAIFQKNKLKSEIFNYKKIL